MSSNTITRFIKFGKYIIQKDLVKYAYIDPTYPSVINIKFIDEPKPLVISVDSNYSSIEFDSLLYNLNKK
jgi:hypothetical protein